MVPKLFDPSCRGLLAYMWPAYTAKAAAPAEREKVTLNGGRSEKTSRSNSEGNKKQEFMRGKNCLLALNKIYFRAHPRAFDPGN
jgi:hypothetical protein